MFDEAFILSRNFLISETILDFHQILSEILQQWQNKLNVINSDETSENFDEDSEKNSKNNEKVDLTLKINDLNFLISIINYILLLMNFMIFQLTCKINSNSIELNII